MELLIRSRWLTIIACSAIAVLVTSCLVGTSVERESRFSHALHATQPGMSCKFCHGDPRNPRLPGPQLCQPCHVQLGLAEAPLDELFDVSGNWTTPSVARLDDFVEFGHDTHTGLACSECHGEIAESHDIPTPTIAKPDCMGCHGRTQAPDGCEVCHKGIDRSWQPPSHATDWTMRHGRVVRADHADSLNQCSLCHDQEQACQRCHQETQPRDHTNHFRLRGHGIAVRIDRTRCSACHRTDFCQVCHENTRPRSHNAGFGSPRNRHCVTCHFPLRDDGCATCHRAAPAHATAAPLPADHNPAMNCRMCHGAGVRLPHPDNGTSCTACHK